jgi:glyoxylase-like metal-dependent hydrolase (beta-lactamase superfamily II)
MEISLLETGNFMLDGGAMFGVIPKSLWSRYYPSDEKNLCNLSLRSLLIRAAGRNILVDTGLGSKQDEKFFSHYHRNEDSTLLTSLAMAGLAPGEITDVIHTHLHLDHCGGTISLDRHGKPELLFPNALHHVSREQWEWMLQPNPLEKPSYLSENIRPMEESGKLRFIEKDCELIPGVSLRLFHGHTAGLVVPFISLNGRTFVFTTDLIPLMAQVTLSWVCGYDTRPLTTFREKGDFLREAKERQYILLFQHDLFHLACELADTEKGIRPGKEYTPEELGIGHFS